MISRSRSCPVRSTTSLKKTIGKSTNAERSSRARKDLPTPLMPSRLHTTPEAGVSCLFPLFSMLLFSQRAGRDQLSLGRLGFFLAKGTHIEQFRGHFWQRRSTQGIQKREREECLYGFKP